MLSRIIAALCIIDAALQALGYKDAPQAKPPASAILTLAILDHFGMKQSPSLFPRGPLPPAGWPPPPGQLPRFPTEHPDGQAHPGDVPGDPPKG